jgi:hypothetical protein
MPRTFKDTLASDALNGFLNVNEFAVEIVHYPGNGGQPELVYAIVDQDFKEQATRQFGVMIHTPTDESGTQIKNRAILELSTDVSVTEEEPGGIYPSVFEIGDYKWLAKRIVGEDDAMQSVEVWRTDEKATKRQ